MTTVKKLTMTEEELRKEVFLFSAFQEKGKNVLANSFDYGRKLHGDEIEVIKSVFNNFDFLNKVTRHEKLVLFGDSNTGVIKASIGIDRIHRYMGINGKFNRHI